MGYFELEHIIISSTTLLIGIYVIISLGNLE